MLISVVRKTHRGLVSEELLDDFNQLVLLFWIQTVERKTNHRIEIKIRIYTFLLGATRKT